MIMYRTTLMLNEAALFKNPNFHITAIFRIILHIFQPVQSIMEISL